MKNVKRTLALLLTLCMVIPMCLVSIVSAETATPKTEHYNFYYGVYENLSGANQAHKTSGFPSGWYNDFINGTVNALAIATSSGQKMYHGSIKVNDKNNYKGLILYEGSAKTYVALLLRNPGEVGEYNLQLSATTGSNSTNTNVYVIPVSEIDSWTDACITNGSSTNLRNATTAQTAIGSVISDDTYLIGTINLNTTGNSETLKFDLAKTVQVDNLSDQYVVVIQIADSNGTYACVQGMTWTEKVDEYDITVDESCKDKVSVSHEKAVAGETVTVTATPDVGFKLAALTVIDANGDPVDVADGQFTMPSSAVTVSAVFVRDTDNYPAAPLSYDFSMGLTGSNVDVSGEFATIYSNYNNDASDVNSLFVGQGSSVADASNYRARINYSPYSGLYMPSRIDLSDSDNPVYGFAAVMIKAPSYAGNYKIEINYWDNTNNTNACRVYMIPASEVQVTVGTYTGPINGVTSANKTQLRTGGEMSSGVAAALDDQYLVGTVDLNTGSNDKTLKPLYVGHQDLEAEEYVVVFQAVETNGNADDNVAFITVGGMTLTETFGETYFTQDGEEKYFDSADKAVEYINALNAETTVKLSTSITTALNMAVNADVTLDLNGNNLSVDYITAFGQIKDSATDDNDGSRGLLTTEQESTFNPENSYFPLKVAENSYSFFKAEVKALGTKESTSENDRMFGLRLLFADDGAYALLGTDGNGLSVRVNVYVDNAELENGNFWFDPDLVTKYIGLEQALTGKDAALILTVMNIHVAAGKEVRVKMTFKLDNTYSAFASVRYEVPVAVTE